MSAAAAPQARRERLAMGVLLGSATLWGLSWWPLKAFGQVGLSGPLLVLLSYGSVGLLGLPLLWAQRTAWRGQQAAVLGLALVGGWANSAFVMALVLGDVVRVMLLFYRSPLWSVLGGRLLLGERLTPRRSLAVACALLGAFGVLAGGGGAGLSAPLGLADALALSAGLAFAGNNLIARAAQAVPLRSKTLAVFLGCAVVSALWLLVSPQPVAWPAVQPGWVLGVLAYGFGWVVLATVSWQFGVTHVPAGRAGVILVAELLVALLSSALWGGSALGLAEAAGAVLIVAGAVIEALSPPDEAPLAASPVTPPPLPPAASKDPTT